MTELLDSAMSSRRWTRREIAEHRRVAKRRIALLYRQRSALIRLEAGIAELEQVEREMASFAGGETHTRAWRLGSSQASR